MKNPNSLFSKSCEFINKTPVGSSFSSKDYIASIGKFENSTWWKRGNKNPHYCCHQYKSMLKATGFIKQISHGVWEVRRHIPAWFDSGHANKILNWGDTKLYNGMSRIDIIAELDMDAHAHLGLIPPKFLNRVGNSILPNGNAFDHTFLNNDSNVFVEKEKKYEASRYNDQKNIEKRREFSISERQTELINAAKLLKDAYDQIGDAININVNNTVSRSLSELQINLRNTKCDILEILFLSKLEETADATK